MHYKGYVITKRKPVNDELKKILEKYYFENENDEYGFSWDWYEMGGRYAEEYDGYYNDMINFDISNCFLVIDDNEKLYLRGQWYITDYIEDKEFDIKVKQIDLKDKFITIIDFHN